MEDRGRSRDTTRDRPLPVMNSAVSIIKRGNLVVKKWDSVYSDEIIVDLDQATKKVKFRVSTGWNKAQLGQKEFEFDYTNDTAYSAYLASHITQNFVIRGYDSMYANMYYYSGYGPNYTRKETYFKGKKVN